MDTKKSPLSITQYIELLNGELKQHEVHIIGEVTQVKTSGKGHVYFTLKDKEQDAILECVIWGSKYQLFGINLEAGMEIIASGTASIYAPWGKLSFYADAVELVGEGALKKKYDELKKKLQEERLFDDKRKRPIPNFPHRIGVITSKQGAVIHDFMNNLGRYGFQITFIDSRVEGAEALPDLYAALMTLKTKRLDLIVIMRGGGSLQSLIAFDAEVLVREIVSSPVPIIAAVGHHQDVPLSALASDKAVSTPTAAANLINTSWDSALEQVTSNSQRIVYEYKEMLTRAKQVLETNRAEIVNKFNRILDAFSYTSSAVRANFSKLSITLGYLKKELNSTTNDIFKKMVTSIVEKEAEINTLSVDRIIYPFSVAFQNINKKLEEQKRLINASNPTRQLSLGYSLVRGSSQSLVKSIKDVKIGEQISILTQDGSIGSEVKSVKEGNHDKTS